MFNLNIRTTKFQVSSRPYRTLSHVFILAAFKLMQCFFTVFIGKFKAFAIDMLNKILKGTQFTSNVFAE
jgi:hypothetical protein